VSFTVPVTVQFQVYEPDVLREVARKHRSEIERYDRRSDGYDADAARFLDHAAEGKGVAGGPKGEMYTWGSVGNYTLVERFVGALRPFFADLYRKGVLWNFATIVVMSQQEQQGASTIIEVAADQTMPRVRENQGLVTLEIRSRKSSFPLFEGLYERAEGSLPPEVRYETWESRE